MIKLHKKFGFVPRSAVWELTLCCNLQCMHCGSRAGKARQDELSTGEALQLCRDLADLGCRQVTLSGGEPLLRKDWALIGETLVERGIVVGMVSNGTLWTDAVASTFKTIGMESVAFSIDGDEQKHDKLRKRPGLYRTILESIERCKRHGITVSVVTTITQDNVRDLEAIREMLRSLGVERWQVQFGTGTGNMADHPELVMDPKDMLYAVPLIAQMCKDKQTPAVYPGHDVGYYGDPEELLRHRQEPIPFWTGCTAGCSCIGIESNGNIKGCLSLPSELNGETAFVEGNIRQTPLKEIWNRKGAFSYTRDFKTEDLGGFCRTCDYAEVCRGGCTWAVYAKKGFVRDNAYCYWRQRHESGHEGCPQT